MDINHKVKFQELLFPEGIYLENNKFRTTKINPILRLISEQNIYKNDLEYCLAAHSV